MTGDIAIESKPPIVEIMVSGSGPPLDWEAGAGNLARAETYTLSTTRPNGRPHATSVLAVWADGTLHFCTGASTRKARNLQANWACVVTASAGGYDLVLEGTAHQVTEEAPLRRIADAFDAKYGWRVTARDGAFHDAEGAPTAGPPPYTVFAVVPSTAFAFGTDEETMSTSTRWRFGR